MNSEYNTMPGLSVSPRMAAFLAMLDAAKDDEPEVVTDECEKKEKHNDQ